MEINCTYAFQQDIGICSFHIGYSGIWNRNLCPLPVLRNIHNNHTKNRTVAFCQRKRSRIYKIKIFNVRSADYIRNGTLSGQKMRQSHSSFLTHFCSPHQHGFPEIRVNQQNAFTAFRLFMSSANPNIAADKKMTSFLLHSSLISSTKLISIKSLSCWFALNYLFIHNPCGMPPLPKVWRLLVK